MKERGRRGRRLKGKDRITSPKVNCGWSITIKIKWLLYLQNVLIKQSGVVCMDAKSIL